jgi:hypothetical protein
VPDASSDAELLDALGVLVDHSLLRSAQEKPDRDQEARLWMLETVRQYAAEQLPARGQADQLATRHAEYFADLAERANAGLFSSEQSRWLARLVAEISNLRAALSWAVPDNNPLLGLRLAAALGQRFWDLYGFQQEDARWRELALASTPGPPQRVRAQALAALAVMMWRWNLEDASRYADQAVSLADQIEDQRLLAWCNIVLGTTKGRADDAQSADRHYEEAARLAALAGDRKIECIGILNRADVALRLAQYESARRLCEQGIAIDADRETVMTMLLLCVLSVAHAHLGHAQEAHMSLRAGAAPARQMGPRAAPYLHACGVVIARLGSAERAARLLGQEEFLREQRGWVHDATEVRELGEALEILHAKLYPAVLSSAWERGRAMSLEEAFAEVSQELDNLPPSDLPPQAALPA